MAVVKYLHDAGLKLFQMIGYFKLTPLESVKGESRTEDNNCSFMYLRGHLPSPHIEQKHFDYFCPKLQICSEMDSIIVLKVYFLSFPPSLPTIADAAILNTKGKPCYFLSLIMLMLL